MFQFRTLFPYSSRKAKNYKFPEPAEPHFSTVKDRVRNSGLTSVRFVSEDTLIAADFGQKKCHLVRIDDDAMTFIDSHDTILTDGTPVETDLIDYRDGAFVVSNFYQGSVSLYKIDNDRIQFVSELETGDIPNMHGLRFVPGYENLLWLTFCNHKRPCHKIMNIESGEILHAFETAEQCQDVAFAGDFAVVFARTNHISKGAKLPEPDSPKNIMYATAFVYRMPEDLTKEPPVQTSEWQGKGHIDACKEIPDGRILCANQYLDRIDMFRVSSQGNLLLTGFINGFNLPHGLDVLENRIAVTNYGDQSLRLLKLPRW